jgi:hypothetical protein
MHLLCISRIAHCHVGHLWKNWEACLLQVLRKCLKVRHCLFVSNYSTSRSFLPNWRLMKTYSSVTMRHFKASWSRSLPRVICTGRLSWIRRLFILILLKLPQAQLQRLGRCLLLVRLPASTYDNIADEFTFKAPVFDASHVAEAGQLSSSSQVPKPPHNPFPPS